MIFAFSNPFEVALLSSRLSKFEFEFEDKTSSQRTRDAIITSSLRGNDVATPFSRNNDVIIASCARWVTAWFNTGPGVPCLLREPVCLYVARTPNNTLKGNVRHLVAIADTTILTPYHPQTIADWKVGVHKRNQLALDLHGSSSDLNPYCTNQIFQENWTS